MAGLFAELRTHWPSYALLWLSPVLHFASVSLTPWVAGWHAQMQFVVPAYLFVALFIAFRRCVADGKKLGMVLVVAFVPTVLGFALVMATAPVLHAALRQWLR